MTQCLFISSSVLINIDQFSTEWLNGCMNLQYGCQILVAMNTEPLHFTLFSGVRLLNYDNWQLFIISFKKATKFLSA